MATPKKTKQAPIPNFPNQLYVVPDFDSEYYRCDKEVNSLVADISSHLTHVAIYELKEIKKLSVIPEQVNLENL